MFFFLYLYLFFLFFLPSSVSTLFYSLSLHVALPISEACPTCFSQPGQASLLSVLVNQFPLLLAINLRSGLPYDRKSTRLISSHVAISYAVFCLKTKPENFPVVKLSSLNSSP